MSLRITNVGRVLSAMRGVEARVKRNLAEGVAAAAKMVYDKSQELVPVETGALKESGRIEVTGTGFGAKATVAYGGPTAPHAFVVHEDLEAYHAPPTCAKYIAKAVTMTRGAAVARVGRQILAGRTQS